MADTVKISQNKAQKVCDVIRLAGRRMLRWISRPRPSISALLSGLIAAFLATLAPAAGALDAAALPTQGSVKVGSGSISQAGSQLTVQQNSQRLGLDWQSFNIGSSATVNFRQPGRDAIALNRVIGNSGSEIFGHLNANGQVFLVNPNGVLFAPGAQVDVGGLVASSLDMSQQDFSAGRYRFASSSGTPTGAVSNFGTLNATEGGYVALFAPQVSNAGSIAVRTGSVMLAAGSAVTVDITGSGLLSAVVTEGASQAIVVNSGSISAQAGSIRLDAKAADALAGSLVNNSGAIAANSLVEKDGAIWLTADQVTHSGSIDTSAKDLGKGGRVVVFGNDTAKVSGSINARGGAQGGDGGFIETSGRRLLDVTRAPDASAPKGKGGTWLLDPYNITIQAAGADTGITGNPSFLSGADDSVITTGTIEAALNAGTSVTVTTGIGGLQDGDITVASPITKSNGGSATLTLSPHNNLMINADITSSSGQLSMVFDPTEGDVVLGSNITLDTNGGSISALGKTVSHSLETVTINNSTFEMGTLNLSGGTLRGNGELIVTNAFNVTGSSTLSGLGLTTRGTSTVEMPGAFGGTFLWIEGSVFWRNEGVLNVSGDDYIYFDPLGDNELYNSGTINLGSTHDRPLENYVYGGLGVSTVFNSGTINLTAPGSHSFAPSLYNTGVLNVGNSSVLTFPNGVTDLEAGTQVTGALGISGGTLHINTDISLPSLTVNSGTLGGSADLTVTGPLEFAYNDAWITGPGKLTTLGTTTIDMPFGRFLTVDGGKTWVNDGTINLLGSAYIYGYGVNGDVTLTNNGTINFNSTHSTSILDYYGGTTLINHGTIKQIAVGTHEFGVYLENHGAIDIASNATLAVTREGRAELIPGTAFSGGGVFSVAGGSVYVNTPLTLSKMNISGGELGVSRDLTVTDTFDVTGYGTVFGLGQLLTQGIGTVSQPMYYMGSGGWRNTGTLNFNDPGRLILGAGAVLTNAPGGTININKTDLVIAGEYNNVGVLDNQGTLKKMQSGTSLIGDSSHVLESFTNAGRIEVSNGTLGVSSNNTNQTGTIEVAGSAVFEKYGGFTNAGTLRGAGTFAVGTGSTLVNNGTIAPGTTTGDTTDSLSITGDVQFGAGSTLNLELGGAGVGDYDALTVSGAVSGVAGSFGNLSLTRINGFTYGNRDTGDSFNLMTAGSGVNTGSFSTAHLLRTNLTPSHTATSYSLLVAPMVLTVDVGALTKVYGEGDPAVGYTVTGFDATTSDDVNIMTGSPVRTAGNNVGDYPFMIGTLATPFDYTIRFTSDSALSITPKMLSVNSVTASNKIYDGNTTATVSGSGLTGVINGDDVTLAGVTGTFDTKHAGTGKTVTISGGSLSGTGAGNYQIGSTAATTTANITKKELGVVTISADDKVYDGTRTATLSFGASTGVVAGDDVSLSGLAGTFDNKDVGAGKTVTVTGGSLIGTDAGNYQITSVAATTTADISQKELNFFSLTAANKVYDGNTTASVSFGGSSGVINGDDVVIAGLTGTFDNRNAGTGKTVTVRGGSLSGADAGNYFVNSGTGTTTADIAPLTVQLSSLSATNKVYDRTAVASVSAVAAPTNKVGDDAVNVVSLIGAFDDKNVGTGKPVSIVSGTLSGTDAGNYQITSASGSTTADITQKDLSVTNVIASNKTYDGTRTATVSGSTLTGVVSGDSVALVDLTGTFDTKNAGIAKVVTISGGTLNGLDAGNYRIANAAGTTTADIARKDLGVASVTAANKVYDGTTAATLTFGASSGVISGDDVSITGLSGVFSDKNVGVAKTVTVSGGSLSGADAGNYQVSSIAASTTADITKKDLGVASVTASNKVYDGTTAATLSFGASSGVISGDDVSITGLSGVFSDKNVGVAKTVTVSGGSLSGADAGNYQVSSVAASTTADITRKDLGVASVTAANKVYDGTTAATLSFGASSGVISGDEVSITGLSGTFDNKNVGTGKVVSVSGGNLSGADAGNYQVSSIAGTTTADITKKDLGVASVTAANKVYDGTTAATLSFGASSGVISGDDVSITGLSGTFNNKNVGTGKTVTVSGGSLSGADAGNYQVSSIAASTTADITRKDLGVASVTAANKVYDGTTAVTLSFGASSGVISGDDVSITGLSGVFSDKNVGVAKTVTVSGGSLSGADAGNYQVSSIAASTTADITKKDLGVASVTASNKVYDGTTAATLSFGASSGVISGDDVSITGLSGVFSDKNVGVAKTVTVSGGSLSGADAGNYQVSSVAASTTADITRKDLGVASVTAANKVYDGTTAATLSFGASSGVISGDEVSITGLSGTFDNKNVGTGKVVSVSGGNLSGADAGNYQVSSIAASTTADITRKDLGVASVTAANKVYDGTTAATLSFGASSGVINGDDVSITGLSGTFDNKNVGTGKVVSVSGGSLSGADAGNYQFNSIASTTSADITKRELGVASVSAANKVYDGTTDATLSFTGGSGVVSGDDVVIADLKGNFDTKDVGTNKTVSVSGGALSGVDAGNYTLGSLAGTTQASITPRPLAIVANTVVRLEGEADPNPFGHSLESGALVTGETLASAVVTAPANTAAALAGTVATLTPSNAAIAGGLASNYDISYINGYLIVLPKPSAYAGNGDSDNGANLVVLIQINEEELAAAGLSLGQQQTLLLSDGSGFVQQVPGFEVRLLNPSTDLEEIRQFAANNQRLVQQSSAAVIRDLRRQPIIIWHPDLPNQLFRISLAGNTN